MARPDIRNIAIIAHVDHGKVSHAARGGDRQTAASSCLLDHPSTPPLVWSLNQTKPNQPHQSPRTEQTTLVDAMLKTAQVFRENEKVQERVMDSNDQERERGITILAKNAAINYGGVKINIVDTPGHADFGGEVERVMSLVDGVLLVVDSVEGPKPQTRFVLKKALAMGHRVVVVVNKIDRPSARPDYVVDKTFDLFCDLNAADDQLDFQIVYASALQGISGDDHEAMSADMAPLFEAILKLPPPQVAADGDESVQMMIANIGYDSFKGKMGIGRIRAGKMKKGQTVGVTRPGEAVRQGKVAELFAFDNLGRVAVEEATAGDIVMFSGIQDFTIGDTIVDTKNPQPLVPIEVEEPTVKMTFGVNKVRACVRAPPDGWMDA